MMDYLTTLQTFLGEWRDLAVTVLHVLIILAMSLLALRLSRKGLVRLRMRMQQDQDDLERIKRLNTLEQVYGSIIAFYRFCLGTETANKHEQGA